MRILGIDPGSRITGYGLIETAPNGARHVENGGIFPPTQQSFSDRINYIFNEVGRLIERFTPDAVALEDIFVAKNVSSTLKLGHARGAIMVAVAQSNTPLFEYTALQVKQAVTGYGHADKVQIQKMVRALLKLPEAAFADASDALAVALCHCHSYKLKQKISPSPAKPLTASALRVKAARVARG